MTNRQQAERLSKLWQERPNAATGDIAVDGRGLKTMTIAISGVHVTMGLADTGDLRVLQHNAPEYDAEIFWNATDVVKHGDVVDLLLRRPFEKHDDVVEFLSAMANVGDMREAFKSQAFPVGQDLQDLFRKIEERPDYVSIRGSVMDFMRRIAGDSGAVLRQEAMEAFFDKEFSAGACLLARQSVANFFTMAAYTTSPEFAMKLPIDRMIAAEHSRIQFAVDKLLEGRDLEVVRTLLLGGRGDDTISYAWYTEECEKSEWRRQVLRVFGLFAADIPRISFLKKAVDQGEPLHEKLLGSIASGLSLAMLKRLGGALNLHGIPLEQFLSSITSLPVDWISKNRKDQQDMVDLVQWLMPIMTQTQMKMDVMCKDSKGKWSDFKKKLTRAAFEARIPEHIDEDGFPALLACRRQFNELAEKWGVDIAVAASGVMADRLALSLDAKFGDTGNVRMISVEHVRQWIGSDYLHETTGMNQMLGKSTEMIAFLEAMRDQIIMPLAGNLAGKTQIKLAGNSMNMGFSKSRDILFADKGVIANIETHSKYVAQVVPACMEAIKSFQIGQKERTPVQPYRHFRPDGISAAMSLGLMEPMLKNQWAPLFDAPIQTPNGLYAAPLYNDNLLDMEGSSGTDKYGSFGLKHCVGGSNYTRKCLVGGFHILSIRKYVGNGSYIRLGTAEFNPIDFSVNPKLHLVQFQFFGNRRPDIEAFAALNWIISEVDKGNLSVNQNNIVNRRELPQNNLLDEHERDGNVVEFKVDDRDGRLMRSAAGYDWRVRSNLDRVMEQWYPVMPKNFRRNSEEIQKFPDILDIAKKISPQMESVQRTRRNMPKFMA